MKTHVKSPTFLALLVLLSILPSCSPNRPRPTSNITMDIDPETGVGPIKFGMSMEEVKKVLGPPDPRPGKPLQYSSLGLAVLPRIKDGNVGAIMMGDSDGGILVDRFKGVTAKGIGMKSTHQQIVAAHGQPESATTQVDGTEVLQYDKGRTQFILRGGGVVHMTVRR